MTSPDVCVALLTFSNIFTIKGTPGCPHLHRETRCPCWSCCFDTTAAAAGKGYPATVELGTEGTVGHRKGHRAREQNEEAQVCAWKQGAVSVVRQRDRAWEYTGPWMSPHPWEGACPRPQFRGGRSRVMWPAWGREDTFPQTSVCHAQNPKTPCPSRPRETRMSQTLIFQQPWRRHFVPLSGH